MKPRDLDPVIVRRLKSDLRYFGETFPERVVEEIRIAGVPIDAPELVLSRKLIEYGEAIRARTANLQPRKAGNVRLTFVSLQQRLLSSIAAFAKTLEVHRKGLLRADSAALEVAAKAFVHGGAEVEDEPSDRSGRGEADPGGGRPSRRSRGALAAGFLTLRSSTRC